MTTFGEGFAIVADGPDLIPCKLFEIDGQIYAFDVMAQSLAPIDDEDIVSLVDLTPARVYPSVLVDASALRAGRRLAANRKEKAPWTGPGELKAIPPVPAGITGYPVAREVMQRHRQMMPPTDRSIFACFMFARTTIQMATPLAEEQFTRAGEDLAELFLRGDGKVTPREFIARWIYAGGGFYLQRGATSADLQRYVPLVRQGITSGLRDRDLRRWLATNYGGPMGIGIAKISFSLALLGHDTICFDSQLLGQLFGKKNPRIGAFDAAVSEKAKAGSRAFSSKAVDVYESLEDAFTFGPPKNPNFDPNDELGRARCQWQSWEAVREQGSAHLPWIKVAAKGQFDLPGAYEEAERMLAAQRAAAPKKEKGKAVAAPKESRPFAEVEEKYLRKADAAILLDERKRAERKRQAEIKRVVKGMMASGRPENDSWASILDQSEEPQIAPLRPNPSKPLPEFRHATRQLVLSRQRGKITLQGDGVDLSLKQIGEGYFSTIFKVAGTDDVVAVTKAPALDKLLLAYAHHLAPKNPHLPAIEVIGQMPKFVVFRMPRYAVGDEALDSVRQEDKRLRSVLEGCWEPSMELEDAVFCINEGNFTSEFKLSVDAQEALAAVENAAKDLKKQADALREKPFFEAPARNFAVGPGGRLVWLDLFYYRREPRRILSRAERAALQVASPMPAGGGGDAGSWGDWDG